MFRRSFFAFSAAASVITRPVTDKDIAQHMAISPEQLKAFPLKPEARAWASINVVARHQHTAFVSTSPRVPLLKFRTEPHAAPKLAKGTTVLQDWQTRSFNDVSALVQHYEAVIAPTIHIIQSIEQLTLESYHLKDIIKLKKVSAAELKKAAERLVHVEREMVKLDKERASYIATSFDTMTFNAIINVLRLCSESDDHAAAYAIRVLEDMTQCKVPFDLTTQLLLKNVCFGDEPDEDSNMLFSFVEYPECGEVSLTHEDVKKVNVDVLEVASKRHGVELTAGMHQQDNGTFPMLPRKQ